MAGMNWLQSLFTMPVFAVAIIVLSVLAGIQYSFHAQWPHAVYWFCAAGLNACVTFWMK
jgi:hypothetical protein